MAPADQTTDPNEALSPETEALVRNLGVAAGHRLDGRYRLDRVLHPTGPALTWLATDEKLNRPTRVHILRSDEPRAQAFMEAARAAAAMPDNHFVQVLDAVPDEGLFYVITEWLHDGHTLGEVLAKGPLPVPEAIRITTELARAMSEAHDSGLAHLRLSPKTVLRTDTGEVKILDLCLAAALTGTVSRDPLGTDLASIGELAYAMLTGRRPGTEPVPPSQLRPEVTPQLDEVVLRTLGDPSGGEAYQTPLEVADALAKLPRPRYEEPMRSTPQTAPLRHQQTQVIATTSRPQAYEPPPTGYQPRQSAPASQSQGSHAPRAAHSGGGHRPTAPAYDEFDGGGGGGGNKNMKIGIGAVAAVAVVALLGWKLMGGNGKANTGANGPSTSSAQSQSTTSGASAAAGAGLKISQAMAYTSKPGEAPDPAVAKAYDGNPATAWNSASYQASTIFRRGSGVVFDLGSVQTISSADITLSAPGAAVQMFAAAESVTAFPTVKDGSKGDPTPDNFTLVKSQDNAPATFNLAGTAPIKTRFVMVWFTSVPQWADTLCGSKTSTCYGDGLAEVKFNGS